MARRLFGIDPDGRTLRIAVATEEKGVVTLQSLASFPYGEEQELVALLREQLGTERRYGDRMATALPAGESFVRRLQFPFDDSRKIEAALELELATQLPVSLEECTADFQHPVPHPQDGFLVAAAAVRSAAIAAFLAPFDEAGLLLQTLDLSPYAQAAGLRSQVQDGVLATLHGTEVTVALIRGGQLLDYRLLPAADTQSEEALCRFLLLESRTLRSAAGTGELPLFLIGAGVTPALHEALERNGLSPQRPEFLLGGEPVAAEFLPAVALALRAGVPEKERQLNFRRGPFALKSEWMALKKKVIGAGILFACALVAFSGAAYLAYAGKVDRARSLKTEMTQIYTRTFPGSRVIENAVPLLMRNKIADMKKQWSLFGLESQHSSLEVLNEISRRIPDKIKVDIKDLDYTPDGVRLEGSTTSFDATNRMAKSLQESPLFKSAQIADAKMSIDGSKVDFRLNITFSGSKENP